MPLQTPPPSSTSAMSLLEPVPRRPYREAFLGLISHPSPLPQQLSTLEVLDPTNMDEEESDFSARCRALDHRIEAMINDSRRCLAEGQSFLTRQRPPPIPSQPSLANRQIDRPVPWTDDALRGVDGRVGRLPLRLPTTLMTAAHVQLPGIRELFGEGARLPHHSNLPDRLAGIPKDRYDRPDSLLPPVHQQGYGRKRIFDDIVDDWEVRRDPKGPRLGPVRAEENPEGELIQYLFAG